MNVEQYIRVVPFYYSHYHAVRPTPKPSRGTVFWWLLRSWWAVARMSFVIYLDHNATTPILPEVLQAMMPYLTTDWGNPSSAYKFGARLKSVIETAREQLAELIGAHPMHVVFTSRATGSSNAAHAAAS